MLAVLSPWTLLSRNAVAIGGAVLTHRLKDDGINGGTVDDFTAGLNWFWNPNAKVQFNYAIAFRDAADNTSDGTIQEAGFRVAFDF